MQGLSNQKFRDSLQSSLDHHPNLNVLMDDRCIERFVQHFGLLAQWNQTHNLIAVSELSDLVAEHYIDCAIALSLWVPSVPKHETIFDLGAGNGFPGVIGATMWPDRVFTLVESLRKKCSFLRAARSTLNLHSLQVEQTRVENLQGIRFAITRAAFSTPMIEELANSFAPDGMLALMRVPSDEPLISGTKGQWMVIDQLDYTLDTGAVRCVVVLKKRI
jgi:16S rRNA (guanine(527)-N(7))-methyltransferase RsmG